MACWWLCPKFPMFIPGMFIISGMFIPIPFIPLGIPGIPWPSCPSCEVVVCMLVPPSGSWVVRVVVVTPPLFWTMVVTPFLVVVVVEVMFERELGFDDENEKE